MSEKIDDIYVSLGLDTDEFDKDYKAASKKVADAARDLSRQQRIAKVKMDIELSGIDNADKSIEGLKSRLKSLNGIINTQKKLVDILNLAYSEIVKKYGETSEQAQRAQEKLVKQQAILANLAKQARETASAIKTANSSLNDSSFKQPALIQQNETIKTSTETSMTSALKSVRNAYIALQAIYASALSFNWLVKANSDMEQWRLQIKVLLNDSKKATQVLASAKEYADKTPFQTGETIEATRMLYSAGIKDIEKFRSAAGDWAAATGRDITEVAAVYARIQSGQLGEAMERMRELNISSLDLMANGISFNKGGEITSSVTEVMDAVNRIVEARFGGMTDELAGSWQGLWSTFTSNAEDAAREMSAGAFNELKTVVKSLNEEMEQMKETGSWQKIGLQISSWISIIKNFSTALDEIGFSQLLTPTTNIKDGLYLIGYAAEEAAVEIRNVAAALSFVKNVATFGWQEASRLYLEQMQNIAAESQKRIAGLKGVSTATEQLENADINEARAAQKAHEDATKAALEKRKNLEIEIERQQKLADTKLAVDKAYHRDSVALAKEQFDNAMKWLAQTETAELAVQETLQKAGQKYNPSDSYLDAQKQYVEAQMGYYDAVIKKAQDLGQYAYEYQRIVAEAAAIEQVGGDATVKRYEAAKQAIKDFLATLLEYQQMADNIALSGAKIQAAITAVAPANSKIAGSITMNGQKIQIANQEIMSSYEDLAAKFETIASREKIIQAQRQSERLQAINAILQSEQLGQAQKKELLAQEAKLYAEFNNTVAQGIAENMQKIESLQQKVVSAASSAISLLKDLGENTADNVSAIWQTAMQAWNATNTHSLQDMQSLMSLAKELQNQGFKVSLPFNANTVMGALQQTKDSALNQIQILQQGITDLVNLAENAGREAAARFFANWGPYLQKTGADLQNMLRIEGSNNIPMLQVVPDLSKTTQTQTNNVNITVSFDANIAQEVDVTKVAAQVCDKVAAKVGEAISQARLSAGGVRIG